MQEQFVTYEIALKLKGLGFDDRGMVAFFREGVFEFCDSPNKGWQQSDFDKHNHIAAPLWQQATDWLERKHSIYIDIFAITTVNEILGHDVYLKSFRFTPKHVSSELDRKKALEIGLLEAIKILN